jgi:hypothetical protein
MVEGATVSHREEPVEGSLQEEAAEPRQNEGIEQPTEESRAAQSIARCSEGIQKLKGNNEGNQESDEPQEDEVVRRKSSAKKQNDISNYL